MMSTDCPDTFAGIRIAVLVPCHNEAATIAAVVGDFAVALPRAAIHVLDNNSSDATAAIAVAAGAQVRRVALQGKGNVVRRGFADVDADIYVLVDGDATYDAAAAPALVRKLISEQLDMVVGARRDQQQAAYRPGHRLGNVLLTRCAGLLFGRSFEDMLSGYRVSRAATSSPMPRMRMDSKPKPSWRCTRCNCACRSPKSTPSTVCGRRVRRAS